MDIVWGNAGRCITGEFDTDELFEVAEILVMLGVSLPRISISLSLVNELILAFLPTLDKDLTEEEGASVCVEA